MTLPSTSHQKRRRAQTMGAIALLILAGLYFSIQRVQTILEQRQVEMRSVEWRRAAASLRGGAQEVPDSDRFSVIQRWSFENGDSLKVWEEKVFKGKTAFEVRHEEGGGYLHSESQNACSGLFVKTDQSASPDLWIDWQWRAVRFPVKKNPELLCNRAEDDFVGRVYVIFLANNLFRSDVIEYVWDRTLPVGTFSESPFSDRIRLVVVRSGEAQEGAQGWHREQRNVYEDYRRLFGRDPRYAVGMVALMSDSDTTKTEAAADFGEILLKRKKN